MSRITAKLNQLRVFFIICLAAQLLVDIVMGWDLIPASSAFRRMHELGSLRLSCGSLLAIALLTAGALFALGLWLFQQLLRRKNWARIVLLVIAWLIVIDAVTSWLFTSWAMRLNPWMSRMAPGLDWHQALRVDRVKDFLGLLYWGYLIFVLQFDAAVKGEFLQPVQAPKN